MIKKLIIIFILINLKNLSYAVSTVNNGQGQLELSEKIIKDFYSYITTGIQNNPINFFITADHNNSYYIIDKNTNYKGYSGSGAIKRNITKCEAKYKQPCYLFSNQRFVVWNNNVNPIQKEKSKLKRKISLDELVSALKDLGFYTKSTDIRKIEEIFDEILKE
tara:strand:- start:1309 stop:1797 length:489 start_codon:yes stop_codon:yes gene_type:complete